MRKFLYSICALLIASSAIAQERKKPMDAQSPQELNQLLKDHETEVKKKVDELSKRLNYPARIVTKGGVVQELVGVSPTGMPIYIQTTNNLDAAKTISTNKVWSGGGLGLTLSGSGMTGRIGIWDGGAVLTTHQEFQSRATQVDAPSSYSDHATHVAGTMVAGGVVANAKGMSFQAPIKCHDWNSDASEMSTAAAAGMLVSNHSYSQISGWQYNDNLSRWEFWGDPNVSTIEDYKYGFYDDISAQWDQIAVSYPNYLMFVAAGNDRGEPGTIPTTFYIRDANYNWVLGNSSNPPKVIGPYNCISGGPSNAKNVITIGAVNKITTGWTKASDVVMSSFSGWGPTDDGRIKPDVVANGVSVYSSISTGNTAYATLNGTSMATPNASGSALLIQQHFNNLKGSFMRSSTLKGLIIHTADEAGSSTGPDYTFGWGLMNTAKAVTTISDTLKNAILQNTLASGSTYTYTFFSDGTTPVRVTICWTDRPGSPVTPSVNPTNKMLVNDLDVRVRRNSDNQLFYPYVMNPAVPTAAATTGDNSIDNVEQVYIAAPTAGTYTITVSHKGSLSGGSQPYAALVSGITPKPTAAFTTTSRVVCSGRTVAFTDASTGATNRMWYFPGGNPSTSTTTNPSVSYTYPGLYPVALRISSSTGYDSVYVQDYVQVGGVTVPFTETFEPTSPTRNFWSVENPNADSTWRLWNVSGNTPGNFAYGINNFDAVQSYVTDRLVSPPIDLRGLTSAQLEFQHAYTRYDDQYTDSLIVQVSTNCGTSYTRIAAYGENDKGSFATAPDTSFASMNAFVPSKTSDWCGGGVGSSCFTLNLTPYVGQQNVRIRFEQKSSYTSNNMFLDNIRITGTPNAPVANFYSFTKTVCAGDEVQLLDSSLNNPNQWFWTVDGADTMNYSIRNPLVKFTSAGQKSIKLVVKNSTGADSITKSGYINVLSSPVSPVVTYTHGPALCDGDSTTLSTDVTSNFIWYKNNLPYSTSLTSFQFKDEASFYVRVLGTNGCFAKSNVVDLVVSTTPAKPVISKNLTNSYFCEGGSFILTSSADAGNQWYVNDTLFVGQIAKTLSYSEAGKFKVRINNKGCYNTSDSLVIQKFLKPQTSEIIGHTWAVKGDTASFSVTPGMTGSTFNWTLTNGTVQSGATTPQVLIKFNNVASAVVNVQENASNGCKGIVKTISINLVNTGISNATQTNPFSVYPNPAKDQLQVSFDKPLQSAAEIRIYNVLGQMVLPAETLQKGISGVHEIGVQMLPSGVYVIRVTADGQSRSVNFVKE